MSLKLENIRTGVDGLKKIIDFLHGPQNMHHIDAPNPTDNMVFYLKEVRAILPPLPHGNDYILDTYEIDIDVMVETGDKKEINNLLEIIKKIYKP